MKHIVVVGGGHAGVEASLAAARMGCRVTLVTTNTDRIGYMSCNPSIGGLAKGHMVREVDVLGGEMGRAADESCIQFKRLNARKGPAVRGSRAQCDKRIYSAHVSTVLKSTQHLSILQSEVKSLVLDKSFCQGVVLEDGSTVRADAVILTTGTFMNGVMFMGEQREAGGRIGDRASHGLSDQLGAEGFVVRRLETGTPARLDGESIDWSATAPQYGDERFIPFSFRSSRELRLPQVACYLSYTNERTHEIIRQNLEKSPMFQGHIEGVGPRYCPSIEDKIVRFADKISHQTFLEPQSLSTKSIYLQGISTSLPADVQQQFLETIPGLEKVKVLRYGYAVEYDFIEPTQIRHSLETRGIQRLFLAGQINGTSGYEEAAAQGLMAGVNAVLAALEEEPFILRRDSAYIGVLIDDLVTKGTKEPYRMFTSRAEFRLALREDNTLERLGDIALQYGLLDSRAAEEMQRLKAARDELTDKLNSFKVVPNADHLDRLARIGTQPIGKPHSLADLLRRPEIEVEALRVFMPELPTEFEIVEPVEVAVKYDGYITRQNEFIKQASGLENLRIPADIDYGKPKGLRREEIEKLTSIRPLNLGQAQRISGVNPSAIQALFIYLKSHQRS